MHAYVSVYVDAWMVFRWLRSLFGDLWMDVFISYMRGPYMNVDASWRSLDACC